jgi:hypothetical protein
MQGSQLHSHVHSRSCYLTLGHAVMQCDRPPETEKCIWFVITMCSDHTKKFWGSKTVSLSGTLQIEITRKIQPIQKSSQTGPKLMKAIQNTPCIYKLSVQIPMPLLLNTEAIHSQHGHQSGSQPINKYSTQHPSTSKLYSKTVQVHPCQGC